MLLPSLTFLQDCCGEFCEAIFVKKKNTVLFQKSVLHKDLFVILWPVCGLHPLSYVSGPRICLLTGTAHRFVFIQWQSFISLSVGWSKFEWKK